MGEGFLVDTDVLIEYVKKRIELPEGADYISEITLYEFIRGVKDFGKAKKALEKGFIVIFNNNEIIKKAAEIWKKLKQEGDILSDADIIIASTAIVNNLTLLTRNLKHYKKLEKFGLKIMEK